MSLPVFSTLSAAEFPEDLPLAEVIANDGRVLQFDRGEVVYNEAGFGNSIFIVLNGHVRIDTDHHDPDSSADDAGGAFWPGLLATLSTLARKRANDDAADTDAAMQRIEPHLEDEAVPDEPYPLPLGPNEIFGVASALRRSRRDESAIACDDGTQVLEVRWPGVRDLRFWSTRFRELTDGLYLSRCRIKGLQRCGLFDLADNELIEFIAESSAFETFGEMTWSHAYRQHNSAHSDAAALEPVIVEQGEQLQDILIVGSGVVRASHQLGRSDQTAGFFVAGDVMGSAGVADDQERCDSYLAKYRLTACGYADVIRVPLPVVAYAQHVIANVCRSAHQAPFEKSDARAQGLTQPVRDFIVDHHLVNGTTAMVINLDRCVNCNDCVRACAATHDGIARFERRGKVHRNFVVAQACMHCRDPVCMIDCPTGAIHRLADSGNVVVDSASCIGCGACANACPYGSIRMEVAGDREPGQATAIKCDLCAGQSGGPACKRACPHDAIERVDFADAEALPDWIQAV